MRKTLPLFIAALLLAANTFAQAPITNGSFENWTTGAKPTPTGWGTTDEVLNSVGVSNAGTVDRDTTAANVYAGTSAVRLTTQHITTILGSRDVPGVVSLGKVGFDFATQSPTLTGVAYADRPDSIRFAAKYTSGPSTPDTGAVILTLTRKINNRIVIISQVFVPILPTATYIQHTIKLPYQSNHQPDTISIQALSGTSLPSVLDSKLWVDDFSFIGLDSTFKAYINPDAKLDFCAGDSLTFESDPSATDSFQWYKDNVAINGATQSSYKVGATGAYSVKVTHASTVFYSDTLTATAHALPVVTYTVNPAQDTLCRNASSVTLTGGSPFGGDYSGTGVSSNSFNPSSATVGPNTVTYTYRDNFECSANATQTIVVNVCSGVESIEANELLSVFPNPANNNITVALPGQAFAVQITDLNGRVLLNEKDITEKIVVNCSNYATGSYFIKVSNQQFQVTRKFVKE